MRSRPALLVATALLGGCTVARHGALPPLAASEPVVEAPAAPRPDGVECIDHPQIDAWEQRLRTEPWLRDWTEQSVARAAAYLPRLRAIMVENGVPPDLAFLPVIESGFEPRARGRSGEVGLWQLRRQTARRFGLQVTRKRDDRLHPERATLAAARYLRFLRARYGEWPLALAAYNAGERRIDRALARRPNADFWELADSGSLPRTSCEFVPRFFAVVRLADDRASCVAFSAGVAPTGPRSRPPRSS
jgi:soluble lytic murein transglycosylase-like protein